RIGPAHHFNRFDILADVGAGDLHAVASEVKNTSTAGLLEVPEPVAVGAGVRFARFGPQDSAQGAVLHALIGFDKLGSIDEVFQISIKDAGLFHRLQHAFRFL